MLNTPSFRRHRELAGQSAQALREYLRARADPKLQLGAGVNLLEGWFNTDLDPQLPAIWFLDVTRPFPVPDATFRFIFSEHQIEHLSYPEGCFMLKECLRVLQPGGVLRLATPDLAALIGLYTGEGGAAGIGDKYIRFITDRFLPGVGAYSPVFVLNNAFRNWGHQFLYDGATLKGAMARAGFTDIVPVAPGESAHAALQHVEKHGHFIADESINAFETMVFEGVRPLAVPELE